LNIYLCNITIVADLREYLDFQDFDKLSLPFVFVGIFLKSSLYNDLRFGKCTRSLTFETFWALPKGAALFPPPPALLIFSFAPNFFSNVASPRLSSTCCYPVLFVWKIRCHYLRVWLIRGAVSSFFF
jgi:hypothetical protein